MLRGPDDVFRAHVLPRLLAAPAELIVDALPPLTPHMRFLEIGAGGGVVARAVVERIAGLGRLVAVDEDLALCAELPVGPRRAGRAQASLPHLPFADRSFEVVIANLVFGDPHRDPAHLAEVHRVLRPGGYLLATVLLAGSFDALFDAVVHACEAAQLPALAAAAHKNRAALPSADDVAARVVGADIAVHSAGVEERAVGVFGGDALLADPLVVDVVLPALVGVPLPPAALVALRGSVDTFFPRGMPLITRTALVVGRVAR